MRKPPDKIRSAGPCEGDGASKQISNSLGNHLDTRSGDVPQETGAPAHPKKVRILGNFVTTIEAEEDRIVLMQDDFDDGRDVIILPTDEVLAVAVALLMVAGIGVPAELQGYVASLPWRAAP